MLTKSAPARVKALTAGDPDGTFEAVVSVFGNIDRMGDVVLPGAFTDTLAEWKASGDPIPVLWSHNSRDPDYHIGTVIEAAETSEGLQIKGQLDLEGPGKARQVYRLLKGRRVTQFSFAYDVLDGAPAKIDGQDVFELRKLKLYEVGPTLVGVNPETRLIGAKSDDDLLADRIGSMHSLLAELKAGRTLSAANEGRIRTAVSELNVVLASVGDAETPKSTTDDSTKAQTGEPAFEPMRRSSGLLLSIAELELAL